MEGARSSHSDGASNSSKRIKWVRGQEAHENNFLALHVKTGEMMLARQVAILGTNQSQDSFSVLKSEVEKMTSLEHDNIVYCIGCDTDEGAFWVFLEHIAGQDLSGNIKKLDALDEKMTEERCRQVMCHLLLGLSYLHNRNIVHGAINGRKLLLSSEWTLKISPFGASFRKAEAAVSSMSGSQTRIPLTRTHMNWTAPEVIERDLYTSKADIWGVGCVLIEILSGKPPWYPLDDLQIAYKMGSGETPPIPEGIPFEAVDFLRRTFERDCEKRPSAEELLRHPWVSRRIGELN